MPETFILIPGRTARQGTSLSEGKLTANYIDETGFLEVCPADLRRLGLAAGDRVRLRSAGGGTAELTCRPAKEGDLPPGIVFLPYGDASSRLIGGETHGTGMPDSKGFDVWIEKITGDRP